MTWRPESDGVADMKVKELIEELKKYPPEFEVRIVERAEGWDSEVHMVESEVYGIDPDKQVGICVN